MCAFNARIVRLVIQVAVSALSLSVVSLVIKAFHQLGKNRKRVQTEIPGGELHATAIVAVGGALLIISALTATFVIPQSMYIMRHKIPLRLRGPLPHGFAMKSMAVIAFMMAPINIAQTYITATGSGHVTSNVITDLLLQALLGFSGKSLRYKDDHTVLQYTIICWFVWIFLLLGVAVEAFKYEKGEDTVDSRNSPHPQEVK